MMQTIAIPYFIGRRMDRFVVPQPAVVLESSLPDALYDVSRTPGSGATPQLRMAELYADLASVVAETAMPLVYAGDCLAVIGVLGGLQRRGIDPTLFWFDAHGDFHTWETTRSGFLGGMPLAMITGRGEQTIVERVGLVPLEDHRIVLAGVRDLDEGEDAAIMESGVKVMTVDAVADSIPAPGPIYVHLDVDVVDPSDLPAINYPAPNGPSAIAVKTAIDRLVSSGQVIAASVSSWNPSLEGASRAEATTRFILSALAD